MTYVPFDLSGSVALVTGGNDGIGLGMALALAWAGADVAVWGRDVAKNDAACAALSACGVRAWAHQAGISSEEQVGEGFRATLADCGRLDTVIANAGTGPPLTPLVDADTVTWRQVLGVNLDGVFWTLRDSARHIVERSQAGDPGGSLVAIASLAAVEGAARNQAYAATKGGVVAMVRAPH